MYGRSSKVPVAKTWTTLGCAIAATARPSRVNRARSSLESLCFSDRILIATLRDRPTSVARNTSPIEPAPMTPSIR
jgi:hypothetical protein